MPALHPLTLAFSGGGAKCAAEAGVLSVLAGAGLPVRASAGVSGGGVVAVLHGLGLSPAAIRNYIAETHLLEVWELDPARRGLFGSSKIHARLRAVVGDKTFADLALPVTLGAADLAAGRVVWLASGPLEPALLATMALPGLFSPAEVDGRLLVDGALLSPLPMPAAVAYGRPVVAVDLLTAPPPPGAAIQLFEAQGPLAYAAKVARRLGLLTVLEVAHQSIQLISRELMQAQLSGCRPDVLLQPDVGQVGLFAFDLAPLAYEAGVAAAEAALPALRAAAQGAPA